MAERIKECFCIDCIHLQRNDPYISGQMALYQCTSQKRNGRCVGWVQKDRPDSGLNTQGGSCCNVLCPGDIVEIKSYFNDNVARYMYCGRLGKYKYLLYRISDSRYYIEVAKEHFRGQTGHINKRNKVIQQNQEQLEASKRMAKKRKKKYVREHE